MGGLWHWFTHVVASNAKHLQVAKALASWWLPLQMAATWKSTGNKWRVLMRKMVYDSIYTYGIVYKIYRSVYIIVCI